jgi:DNA-binding NarL/FixJ family response regulator
VRTTGLWDDRPVRDDVLIVDDHAGFRASARALLTAAGFAVVGEASDAAGAIEAAARLRPALVLLDVQLPDGDGFDVARVLAADAAPPAVLLVSVRDRPSYRRRVEDSPVRAFVPKDELTPALLGTLLG